MARIAGEGPAGASVTLKVTRNRNNGIVTIS